MSFVGVLGICVMAAIILLPKARNRQVSAQTMPTTMRNVYWFKPYRGGLGQEIRPAFCNEK